MAASAFGAVGCNSNNKDSITGPSNPTYLINVTPGNNNLAVGGTQQLTAAPVDFYNKPVTGQTITWESSFPAVATVSATGLVTMVTAGSTTIVARSGGAYGVAVVSSPAPIASVIIAPIPATLAIPLTLQLSAQALDANGGQLLPPSFTYSSSAPTIVSVSASGVVTAIAPGSATITATVGGKSASVVVNSIVFTPVGSIAFSSNISNVSVGGTLQLNPVIKDTPGNVLIGKPVTYLSSAPAVASVSATGLVTMLTAGAAFITATSETKSAYIGVTSAASSFLLQNNVGVPVAGAKDANLVFQFLVPPGSTAATITLTGGTGDPDIYVYKPGVPVDLSASNIGTTCFSFNDAGITESCSPSAANIATPGVWQVQVNGFSAFAGWTLKVNVITP